MGLHLKSRKQNGHRMKSSCKSPLRELGNKCDWLCAIGYAAQEHLRGAPISRRAWQSFELKRFQDPNCQSVVPMGVTKLVLGKSNFQQPRTSELELELRGPHREDLTRWMPS
jgi:hypothetical protein